MTKAARSYNPTAAGLDRDLPYKQVPVEPVSGRVDPLLATPITMTEGQQIQRVLQTGPQHRAMRTDRTHEPVTPEGTESLRLLTGRTPVVIMLVVLVRSAAAAEVDSTAASGQVPAASAPRAGGKPGRSLCSTTSENVRRGDHLLQQAHYAEARATLYDALQKLERSSADTIDLACLMNLIAYLERHEQRPQLAIDMIRRALAQRSLPGRILAMMTSPLAAAHLELNDLESTESSPGRPLSFGERLWFRRSGKLFAQTTLALVHVAAKNMHVLPEWPPITVARLRLIPQQNRNPSKNIRRPAETNGKRCS